MHPPISKRQAFVERAREIALRHFDESATKYDTIYGSIEPVHAECVRQFLGKLGPDSSILDAACGTGNYFGMLALSTGRVLGIDQSEAMLDQARQKWPGVETRRLALQDLHSSADLAGKFGGVVCIDALEWIMRADWPNVLAGFRNVLAGGGILYITVEKPGEEESRALAVSPEEGAVDGEITVHYWYNHFPDVNEVLAWTLEYGFRKEAHRQCAHYHHLLLRLP